MLTTDTPAKAVSLRRAVPADAAECGRICYEAFAAINASHNFPPEMPSAEAGAGLLGMLFSHPEFYAVVAEREGRIAGSNCLDERSVIAGVGPITVDPGEQNQGVGRRLMQAVLERANEEGFSGVRLVQAAFHSRSLSLYAKLGFQVREPLVTMAGAPIGATMDGYMVRPARMEDLPACNRICANIHGHDRAGELRDGIANGTATVVQRQGRVTGYSTLMGYFGHAAAETTQDVQALIAAAGGFAGPGILIPTRNAELFRWCLANGLRVVQPLNLMSLGLYNEPAGAYLPSILF